MCATGCCEELVEALKDKWRLCMWASALGAVWELVAAL